MPYFKERELSYVDIIINAQVPGVLWWTRTITIPIKIALFPKYPIKYEMRQIVKTKAISKIEDRQKGTWTPLPPHTVDISVCVDVPPGGVPLRIADERTQGTAFLMWDHGVRKTDIGFCWEISNNGDAAGLATFDVIYFPLIDVVDTRRMFLRAVSGNDESVEEEKRYLKYGVAYNGEFDKDVVDFEIVLTDFTGRVALISSSQSAVGYDVPSLTLADVYKKVTLIPKRNFPLY